MLGLFTFFIFANTIGNGYNMDDGIVTNGHKLTSQGLSAIREIFTSNYYSDAMGYAFGYRPMVHLSFALEHELFGEKPGAGHFINVILFALTVAMFFKFLIKCVGEKNILFAGVAALLFAVHPVHTEVVDSLKNRDELLAFFFVVWAGLVAFKFVEKGKWISIIFVAIIFSLAMLSKKSVYPMAIVIPGVILLVTQLTIKQLALIAASFIIPAGIIGSELSLSRSILMIGLPAICIAVIYLIKISFLSNETEGNEKIKGSVIPLIGILIVLIFSISLYSIELLFATLPFFVWLFKVNYKIALLALIISLISVDVLIMHLMELQLLAVFLGFGFAFYQVLKTKEFKTLWIVIGLSSIMYFLFYNHSLLSIIQIVGISGFIFLVQRKSLIGVILSIALICVAIYLSKFQIIAVLFLLTSVSLFIFENGQNIKWIQYTAVIAFSIVLGFILYENNNFKDITGVQSSEVSHSNSPKFVKNKNILKEGRQLEFVENTLVASHTTEEKIGTGFATLGEYFRLMSFPYELSFYYGYAKTDTHGLRNVWVWLFILIHLGMLVLAFFHVKKNPLISVGVFWYLACILLFSNWVELVAGMVGERLAFTASAGFCIFVTGILFWLKPDFNFKKPGVAGYALIVVVLVFAGRTMIRNTDWKDTITLMGNDISHLKNSSQANNIYAMHLMAESTNNRTLTAVQVREMQSKAIKHFDRATEIWPDYYNVYIDKARATILTGDYQEGINSLEKAMKVDPKNEFSYYIALDICERMNDNDLYLKNAQKLFELNQNEHAYGAVARGYFLKNDLGKSKELLLEGLEKYPNNDALKYNLTLVEQKEGNFN